MNLPLAHMRWSPGLDTCLCGLASVALNRRGKMQSCLHDSWDSGGLSDLF